MTEGTSPVVGSIVLYHRDAEAAGEAAMVVGVNAPAIADDTAGVPGSVSLNLLVFPDADGLSLDDVAAAVTDGTIVPDSLEVDGWFPFRAIEVVRDQPGKATGPYWSPVTDVP